MKGRADRQARLRRKDLHGCRSAEEALISFVSAYNSLVQEKRDDALEVVHGYGSSRGRGKIKRQLHQFLRQHSECIDAWVDGDIFQNPGITIVYPRWALPQP